MRLMNVMLAPMSRVNRVKTWGKFTVTEVLYLGTLRPYSQKKCDPGDQTKLIFGDFLPNVPLRTQKPSSLHSG